MQGIYRVDCTGATPAEKAVWPALSWDNAVSRAEAERVKAWRWVLIREETTGAVMASYHGALPIIKGT